MLRMEVIVRLYPKYKKIELLILDEWLITPLSQEEAIHVF